MTALYEGRISVSEIYKPVASGGRNSQATEEEDQRYLKLSTSAHFKSPYLRSSHDPSANINTFVRKSPRDPCLHTIMSGSMSIARSKTELATASAAYIRKLLRHMRFSCSNPVHVPSGWTPHSNMLMKTAINVHKTVVIMRVQLEMSNGVRLPRPTGRKHISIYPDSEGVPHFLTLEESTEKDKKSQFD